MRKTLRYSLLSLLMLVCGFASAQTTVTFDAATDLSAEGSTAGETSITKDGITLAISNGIMGNGQNYRCYKGATFTVTSTVGNITNVELTSTANNTSNYGPGNFVVADGNYSYEGKIGTWTGNASTIEFTAQEGQVRMTQVVVTYNSDPTAVAAPVITGNDVFEGTTTVTITGEEGTTIYYTTDGSDPTTASASGTSPVSFDIDATTTVKAIAGRDDKTSTVATKEFTLVTFANETIASLNEKTEDEAYVNLTLTNAKVTYVDGSNVYLREGDKALMFFNTSIEMPVNAIVSGSVRVDYYNYFGIHEVKDNSFTTADNLTITESEEAAVPTSVTIEDILALNHICDYVILNGVTITSEQSGNYTNFYANSGDQRVQLYRGIDLSSYAGDGKKYDVIGVFNNIYNGNAEIQPIEVSFATGISGVEADKENAEDVIYNIAGQRLQKPQKGLNIINGKKVIVK